ncbi:MAG TPA: TonB-dependent receptor [Bryobacteraceae bacterium]|jgi:outer membrane cobalamin receptor|nr:TonB-dependent receptor [Bryobacteraceae bacterium]
MLKLTYTFLLIGSAAFGQSISGLVNDPQGAAIPAAVVTLTARDNTAVASAVTDSTGRYRFDHVFPDEYLLEASAQGFDRSGARLVSIQKSDQANVDFDLRVAAIESSVLVTASSTAQTTDELSKAVSVVDAAAIDASDESSITDALRYVPGLRIAQLGGPGALVSIKTWGSRSEDTAVLIDGFRVRDASAERGDATSLLQDLMVTDLDRIEVMRGAGSSLYGTNAVSGVVNVITASGGGRTRGSLLAEGGSLDMFRGRAEVAGALLSDRLDYSLGLSHLNVLSGVTGNEPARATSVQGRLDYKLSATTHLFGRILAADSFSKVTNPSPQAAGNLPPSGVIDAIPLSASELHRYEAGASISDLNFGGATFIPAADDPDNTLDNRLFSGALRLSVHPAESLDLSASYQGLVTHRRYGDGPAGTGVDLGFQPSGTTLTFFDGDIHTASARMDWRLGRHQLLDAGYEFEYEKYGNHSVNPIPSDNSAVDVSQQSHALFVQDQVSLLGDRLQVAGSYRAQIFSLRQPLLTPVTTSPYTGTTFAAPPTAQTGDGSVAYLFRRSGTKIRAHVGRGYRAPSLYERFGTYFFAGFGYLGDPRLRPERTIGVDGGIDQALWNGRARLSATYFYTRFQEAIGFTSFATDPLGRFSGYFNTNGGLARGVEANASLAPTRSTNLLASYTFTNARESTPVVENILQTFVIPDHQFSLTATQRLGPRVTAVFDLLETSNYLFPLFDNVTFATRAYRFPGRSFAELGGSYRIPMGEYHALRFFAKVSNLFKQSYYESGYRTPGATATGGLQYQF